MRHSLSDIRVSWLVAGLVAGLGIAYFWPHEPAYATNADRDSSFAMVTVSVGTSAAGINDPMEGVFILDFLTGQLKGAVLNRQTGKFASLYYRELAIDFDVDPEAEPHYAMVTGFSQLASRQGSTYASGVVYIGELSSGKVLAYAFPWKEAPRPAPQKYQLQIVDGFQWRVAKEKTK
ncbi:MAG: hypothetical protein EXS05_01360 [Planctomycetaceae bacterium]|nr:hypothetical protein [Planctomycetaceae bacterium]